VQTGAKYLPGFRERFLDVRGAKTRYFVAGDGPPIVLVHGLTGAAANWVEIAPSLARDHRVLIPELPGHGGSSPLPATPGIDALADRVHDAAADEGMLPAVYVGHSLGGLVALRLGIRRPETVKGIVLVGAAGIGSATRRAQFWVALFGMMRPGKRVAPLRRMLAGAPSLRGAVFNRWQVADPVSMTPEAVHGLLASVRLHSDVVSAGRALVRDDPRTDLDRVTCPCLVVWGARDRQVFVDDAFEYARRLRAPLRTIADCGHLLIAERPAAVLAAIRDFLDGVRQVDELPLQAEPSG
jgi:pimeloyl-ACP methyl ester carboxylesterase